MFYLRKKTKKNIGTILRSKAHRWKKVSENFIYLQDSLPRSSDCYPLKLIHMCSVIVSFTWSVWNHQISDKIARVDNKSDVLHELNEVWQTTRAVQKVRSCVFCLFFRQHWNELPRGEYSGGFYDHTVKIWRLYVCFSSCFNPIKVKLSVSGAAKFEMCGVIHFLHTEGQLANLESHFSAFFSLEIHFWSVPEAKNAVQSNFYPKGRGHPILNFQ